MADYWQSQMESAQRELQRARDRVNHLYPSQGQEWKDSATTVAALILLIEDIELKVMQAEEQP